MECELPRRSAGRNFADEGAGDEQDDGEGDTDADHKDRLIRLVLVKPLDGVGVSSDDAADKSEDAKDADAGGGKGSQTEREGQGIGGLDVDWLYGAAVDEAGG